MLGEPITSQAILCRLFLSEYFHLYQCFDFLKYFYLEIVELLKKQRVKKKRNRVVSLYFPHPQKDGQKYQNITDTLVHRTHKSFQRKEKHQKHLIQLVKGAGI